MFNYGDRIRTIRLVVDNDGPPLLVGSIGVVNYQDGDYLDAVFNGELWGLDPNDVELVP